MNQYNDINAMQDWEMINEAITRPPISYEGIQRVKRALKRLTDAATAPSGIYCLFSVMNAYDQPKNNLVAWWPQMPTVEQVGKVLEVTSDAAKRILNLPGAEVRVNGTDYRIENIPPDVSVEEHQL